MEAVENEKIPATVYYSEKDDKKNIECVRFQEKLYVNTNAEEGCELTTREPEESTETFKSHIFTITAEELKKTENLLAFVAQRAQEELAKLPVAPPAPPAPVSSGIAAGSRQVDSSAAKNTYNIHALIDKCRPEINAKINPKGYSLPDGKYELVMKHGHKITIEANGNMAADLAPISSRNETDFAKHICDDLKAIVDMYMAMHTKLKDAVFPENKINLYVIKKDIKSEEDKIKIAKIEKLVAQEMHAYLSKPEHAVLKDKFTVLGQAVTKPAPAPAPDKKGPKPSAPPLSEEDARKAAENSDVKLPVIIPIQGKVDAETYKQNLQAKAKGTAPEKSAFIFPGNDGHAATNDIHGKKSGSGLAQAADELGQAGIGTLSLPTTFFDAKNNSSRKTVNEMADSEVAKLWQAVGAGYQLVLPVRNQSVHKDKFFGQEDRNRIFNITQDKTFEPSFWGSAQSEFADNTDQLRVRYTEELGHLQNFIQAWNKPDANKKQLLDDLKKQKPDCHSAFINGFANDTQNAPKPAAAPPDTPGTPDSLRMGRK